MTVTASASTSIGVDARTVLEFVMDLKRYAEVDSKIIRVGDIEGPDDNGRGSVRIWGRVRGTPPAPDKQDLVLEPWERLTFTGAPRQPGRLVFDFVGSFECQPGAAGTEVTHSYRFDFKGPFRVLERGLGQWLQAELDDEVAELRRILEP